MRWFRPSHGGAAGRVRHTLPQSSVPCSHASSRCLAACCRRAWLLRADCSGSGWQASVSRGCRVAGVWRRKCPVRAPRLFWLGFQSVGEGGLLDGGVMRKLNARRCTASFVLSLFLSNPALLQAADRDLDNDGRWDFNRGGTDRDVETMGAGTTTRAVPTVTSTTTVAGIMTRAARIATSITTNAGATTRVVRFGIWTAMGGGMTEILCDTVCRTPMAYNLRATSVPVMRSGFCG